MGRWICILALLWLANAAHDSTEGAIFLTGMFLLLGMGERKPDHFADVSKKVEGGKP